MARVLRSARPDEVWVGLTAPVTRVHWPATVGAQLDLPGRVEFYLIPVDGRVVETVREPEPAPPIHSMDRAWSGPGLIFEVYDADGRLVQSGGC